MKAANRRRRGARFLLANNNRRLLASLFVLVFYASVSPAMANGSTATDELESAKADEVTVTARRRPESIHNLPISVTVLPGADLQEADIRRLDDLAGRVANVLFTNSPTFSGSTSTSAIYIRGVGQREYVPTVDSPVGLYVDDVYIARNVGALKLLGDIDQIEILRGPQGTYLGRNTTGGAVSVKSRAPEDGRYVDMSLTTGSDGRVEGRAVANVGFSDHLQLRALLAASSIDGYVRRLDGKELGAERVRAGRLFLRWTPDPAVTLDWLADGHDESSSGPAFVLSGIDYASKIFNPQELPLGSTPGAGVYVPNPPNDAPLDNFSLLNNYVAFFFRGLPCIVPGPSYDPAGATNDPRCYNEQYVRADGRDAGTAPSFSEIESFGTSLKATWEKSNLTARSLTAYRTSTSNLSRDGDHSPILINHYADAPLTNRQLSQEVQLQGERGRVSWVAGALYFREEGIHRNRVDFLPVAFLSGGDYTNTSYAVFGAANISFNERWSINTGLRWTSDHKSFLPVQYVLDGGLTGLPTGTPVLPHEESEMNSSKLTPAITLSSLVTNNLNLYASYAEGFRSGGFTQRVFPPLAETPTFGPEQVQTYEFGVKANSLESAELRAAAFISEYKDIQISVSNGIAPVIENAGAARVRGIELESRATFRDSLALTVGTAYLDTQYSKIPATAVDVRASNAFEHSSKWSFTGGLEYFWNLKNAARVTSGLLYSYRTKYFVDARNTPELMQQDLGVLDAHLSFVGASEKWEIWAVVSNATNEKYVRDGIFLPLFSQYELIQDRGQQWSVNARFRIE